MTRPFKGKDVPLTGRRIERIGFELADDASIDLERQLVASTARD